MTTLMTIAGDDSTVYLRTRGSYGYVVERRVGALLALEYYCCLDTLDEAIERLNLVKDDYIPYATKYQREY